MGGRRKQAGTDNGLAGDLLEGLIALARRSPAIGLTISAAIFAFGAFLFWGDPKRWHGLGPIAGLVPLLLGTIAGTFALVYLVRDLVAPRGSAEGAFDTAAGASSPAGTARTSSPPPSAKTARDGAAFERAVADLFRQRGYAVEATGTHGTGGDRGIDLILRCPTDPAAAIVCVQCKDFADWRVGAPDVRAFHGAVCLRGPGHTGIIVTTSRFTADAKLDAAALGITLIDGEQVAAMRADLAPPAAALAPTPPAPAVPRCPACKVLMVRRDPKPGGKVFRPFWGCPNYPGCRRTMDIA